MQSDKIKDRVRDILIEQYELIVRSNYHPQTLRGIELKQRDEQIMNELEEELNTIMHQNIWLKSSYMMKNILLNNATVAEHLTDWINSLDD